MYDPVADSDSVGQKPIAPRLESIENKRIGLLDNGKPAAGPLLSIIQAQLEKQYPNVTIEQYAVDHLNRLKNEDELAAIEAWAEDEIDACIGAMGDCGSCTKYLVYGINAAERAGTPAIGLIDEGFVLDWKSNSSDFGRELRYYTLPAFAEVTDRERIVEYLTADVLDEIVADLTGPRTDEERVSQGQKGTVVKPEE